MPGGLIRSEHMEGVLYEPHGSHIFHTEDTEVWELANAMTPFNDYRHRVDIVVDGGIYNWPILVSDIDAQSRSEEIHAQLREREGVDAAARAEAANFEEWCLELMGPVLYERYIKPYTEKQWGRPARELSAQWAPRRVSVRRDGDPYLFPDPYQGWPAGPNGYTDLIDGLLDDELIELRTGVDVTLGDLESHPWTCAPTRSCSHARWTCSAGNAPRQPRLARDPRAQRARPARRARPGGDGRELPRRGVPLHPHPRDQARLAARSARAPCWASSSPARPRATTRSSCPRTGSSTTATRTSCATEIGDRVHFAGRLANYLYIDMDDCMRQALDTAEGEVLPRL